MQITNKYKLVIIAFLCLILFYAPVVQAKLAFQWYSIYSNPFYRMIEFSIGVIIAQVNTSPLNNSFLLFLRKPFALALSLIALVAGISLWKFIPHAPHTFMMCNVLALPCFIIMLISLGSMKFDRVRVARLLLYLSRISFCFFLCQVLPLWDLSASLCEQMYTESNIAHIIVSFIMCFLGAVVIHHSIEIPISTSLKSILLRDK